MSDHPTIHDLRQSRPPSAPLQPALRIPRFLGVATEPAKVLANLNLAFVGVGSVGLNAVLHAARMGVGSILVCDSGGLKKESTITHPLLGPASGISKALFAGRACRAINSAARIRVFQGPVQVLPWTSIANVDAVILATDNPAAEAFTGQVCQRLRRTLIHCSVHGETLVAHAKLFTNAGPDSACPACLFGDAEMSQLHSAVRFACDGTSPPPASHAASVSPTMSVSHLCAQSACLGINLLLRHFLALGEPVADTLVEYCGYTNRCVSAALRRRSDCLCDHTAFTTFTLAQPLSGVSPRVLAEAAGFTTATSWETLTFEVGGYTWLESARCRCPQPRPVRRFLPTAQAPMPSCRCCGQRATLQPFFSHRMVPASRLRPFFDQPLRKLGARRADWAVVHDGADGVFIHHQTPTETKS